MCCVQFKSWVEEKECLSLVFKMRPLLYVLTLLMVAVSHVINPITATRGLRLCLPWGYGGRTAVHLSSNNSTNIQAINLPFNVSIVMVKAFQNVKKYWPLYRRYHHHRERSSLAVKWRRNHCYQHCFYIGLARCSPTGPKLVYVKPFIQ